MRPHLNIFVATLVAIPIAAGAQTPRGTEQPPPAPTTTQPSEQQPPAQATTQPSEQQPSAQTTTQPSEQLKPATATDIKAGAKVFDQKGGSVGTVDSVDAEGVVVSTGSARVKIPLSSFALGQMLVIGATKADLEAAAKKEAKPKSK